MGERRTAQLIEPRLPAQARAAAPLVDSFARQVTYLRLSVTDRCDLRCTYCMPERMTFLPKREILTLEELHDLAQAFIARGIRTIRITGGEPLVRRDVVDLIGALGRQIGHGLDELTLTTNATQLARHADHLARAGVRRVNVSLDTLERGRFAALTGRDSLPDVFEGIAAAQAAGLAVKLNIVALRANQTELPDLIRWAHGQGHQATLIEVMPLGKIDGDRTDQYVSLGDIRAALEQSWTLTPSPYASAGPARYFDIAETGGRLGMITPLSDNFCAGCNRLRVTATGQLFPCLGGGERVDLRAALRSGDPQAALAAALDRAMAIKPERHDFRIGTGERPAQPRHMSVTGG